MTQKGWNVPAERPEYNTEEYRNEKIKTNLRSEPFCNRLQDDHTDQAHDNNLVLVTAVAPLMITISMWQFFVFNLTPEYVI